MKSTQSDYNRNAKWAASNDLSFWGSEIRRVQGGGETRPYSKQEYLKVCETNVELCNHFLNPTPAG